MNRPAFQFYTKDWRNNPRLRRCSPAARGTWIDIMCLMHDSDEYGVLRWPLEEIAHAAGADLKHVRELVSKQVMKGSDESSPPYVHTPRHAGKDLEPVTLLVPGEGPCWYSTRMVRDEWMRSRRGFSTRFSTDTNPAKGSAPKVAPDAAPKPSPTPSPTRALGGTLGDGPAVCSLQFEKLPSVSATTVEEARPVSQALAALALGEAKIDTETPAAHLASVCLANGIRASAFHPLVVEWARNGVTVEGLKAAIAKARLNKPFPEKIPPAYLDPILADASESKPRRDQSWKQDDNKARSLCRELGIPVSVGNEGYPEFHARIERALLDRERRQVA